MQEEVRQKINNIDTNIPSEPVHVLNSSQLWRNFMVWLQLTANKYITINKKNPKKAWMINIHNKTFEM